MDPVRMTTYPPLGTEDLLRGSLNSFLVPPCPVGFDPPRILHFTGLVGEDDHNVAASNKQVAELLADNIVFSNSVVSIKIRIAPQP